MISNRLTGRLAACGLAVVFIGGCGFESLFGPSRTTDGGGGNLLSAGFKLLAGQLTSLTQDEIQILADEARTTLSAFDPSLADLPQLTNEQADAYLEFLEANGLTSIDTFLQFSETAGENPDIVVIPDSLVEAFADTDVDVDENNVDVDQLFGIVFAGMQTSD